MTELPYIEMFYREQQDMYALRGQPRPVGWQPTPYTKPHIVTILVPKYALFIQRDLIEKSLSELEFTLCGKRFN